MITCLRGPELSEQGIVKVKPSVNMGRDNGTAVSRRRVTVWEFWFP